MIGDSTMCDQPLDRSPVTGSLKVASPRIVLKLTFRNLYNNRKTFPKPYLLLRRFTFQIYIVLMLKGKVYPLIYYTENYKN